jgi:hypothetical protein
MSECHVYVPMFFFWQMSQRKTHIAGRGQRRCIESALRGKCVRQTAWRDVMSRFTRIFRWELRICTMNGPLGAPGVRVPARARTCAPPRLMHACERAQFQRRKNATCRVLINSLMSITRCELPVQFFIATQPDRLLSVC